MEVRDQIFGSSPNQQVSPNNVSEIKNQTETNSPSKIETFQVGKLGETVKIDFDKLKNSPDDQLNAELQKSCVELIDQLAFYYNNFNSKML
jgi:hypothetical protein